MNFLKVNTILSLGLVILLGASQWGCTTARKISENSTTGEYQEKLTVATLRSPKGDIESISSDPNELKSDGAIEDIGSLPVTLNMKKYLCNSARETEWRRMHQVESELELSFMVDTVKEAPMPRYLSDLEKKSLSRIPRCNPFLFNLRLLAKLIKGYDLVNISYQ